MAPLQVRNDLSHEPLAELHFEPPGTAGQLKTCIAGCRPDVPLHSAALGAVLWKHPKEPGRPAAEVEDEDEDIDADGNTYTYLFHVRTTFDVWKDMEHYITSERGWMCDVWSWSCQSAQVLRDRMDNASCFEDFAAEAEKYFCASEGLIHSSRRNPNPHIRNFDFFERHWLSKAEAHVQECRSRCRVKGQGGPVTKSRVIVSYAGRDDVQRLLLCEAESPSEAGGTRYYIIREAMTTFGLPWLSC